MMTGRIQTYQFTDFDAHCKALFEILTFLHCFDDLVDDNLVIN